jgi:hypothetical protein
MASLSRFPWTSWLPNPGRRWHLYRVVEAADEIPDRIPRKAVVLVGSVGRPTWIAFDCPCSERHRVMLNADRSRWPRWTIKKNRHLTLAPSIDETRGSTRCHYLIQRGRVRWVRAIMESGVRDDRG